MPERNNSSLLAQRNYTMATNRSNYKDTRSSEPTFPGFEPPTSNFFRMPVSWTDITAKINNLAELKVVEYILRHTWGFQEYGLKKHITIDEFVNGRRRRDGTRMDQGTGLSERGVRYGLDKAVEDGLIEEEVDDSDRGRQKKYYSLRMRQDSENGEEWEDFHEGVQSLHPGVQSLPPRGAEFAPRSEKDTLERNFYSSNIKHFEEKNDYADEVTPGKRRSGKMESIGNVLDRTRQKVHATSKPVDPEEVLRSYVTDLARELGDEAKLSASVKRVMNLYLRGGFELSRFIGLLMEARSRTREYAAQIKKRSGDKNHPGRKNQFPYFLAVVEDLVGLREKQPNSG